MEIKFEISDEAFNEGYKDIINDIPNEEKIKIVEAGLKEYVKSDEFIDKMSKLFFERAWVGHDTHQLTIAGKSVIIEAFSKTDGIQKLITDTVVDILKNDGEKILREALTEIIIHGFASNPVICNAMEDTVRRVIQNEYRIH